MKGGVGKTAAAVNLAFAASSSGFATLLCDLDAQGSASFYFRIKPKGVSARRLVTGSRKAIRAIKATDFDRLDVLPASMSFRHLDIRLDTKGHSMRLAMSLYKIGSSYDLVILDTHAGLGAQAEAVLNAADMVLLPVIPTILSQNTLATVRRFFTRKNLDSDKIRFFLSMVDRRRQLHRTLCGELQADPAFVGISVPYSSDVERMGVVRKPLCASHPHCDAAGAYIRLWAAVRDHLDLGGIEPEKPFSYEE